MLVHVWCLYIFFKSSHSRAKICLIFSHCLILSVFIGHTAGGKVSRTLGHYMTRVYGIYSYAYGVKQGDNKKNIDSRILGSFILSCEIL